MASLNYQDSQGRKGWRIRFRDKSKRQKSIWLGDIAEHIAIETKAHVEHLIDCVRDELPPERTTTKWLASLDAKLRNKLANVGLCESVEVREVRDLSLGEWTASYIAERSDVAERTSKSLTNARTHLINFFGEGKKLRSIKKADAKRWRIWMLANGNRRDKKRSDLAEDSVRRYTGRAKQFYKEAMERGYVEDNPFDGLPCMVGANEKRKFFVPQEWINKAIEHCPNTEWRTILALARFGGLRCPSEVAVLKWADVNLPEGRFGLDSPKTGWRLIPIFPELRPYLEAAWDDAPEGAEFVCPSVGPKTNLRTQFTRIIKRAGLNPWPRLIQNLRASRVTELHAKFPAKDAASWLGHSAKIAVEHYAMQSEDSFRKAAGMDGCHTGCHISGQTGASPAITEVRNTPKNHC